MRAAASRQPSRAFQASRQGSAVQKEGGAAAPSRRPGVEASGATTRQHGADSLHFHAEFRPAGRPVTLLYLAAACLVIAQVLGVYGLVTRKADLIFSLFMIALVVTSFVLGGLGVYQQLG